MDVRKEAQFLARSLTHPTADDMRKVIQVWQYLHSSPSVGPTYFTVSGVVLSAFIDAAFAVHIDGSSQSGGYLSYGVGNSPVCCLSRAQDDVALSPCAGEYYGMTDLVKKILEERNFLESLGYLQGTTILYEDSLPAIGLVYSPSVTRKARYMHVRHHFIRQLVERKIIKVVHVSTKFQSADLFTHPLPPKQFQFHLSNLFNFCSSVGVACMSSIQLQPYAKLIVKESGIDGAGLGCFANQVFLEHEIVGSYTGPYINASYPANAARKKYMFSNSDSSISICFM
jgi:hypothetical protein